MRPIRISKLCDLIALLAANIIYWLSIWPQAHREIARWQRRALLVPDPKLRELALHKLTGERLNPEAAAVYAMLAPLRRRRRVVRLIVAYQILYDYLDAVNELPASTYLTNGLWLHRALVDAVSPNYRHSDYYRYQLECDDGGYLSDLVGFCSQITKTLPSAASMTGVLLSAAQKCGAAQSHNHATASEGDEQLERWCEAQRIDEYLWWEVAAAGISVLVVHALTAAAAHPDVSQQEASQIRDAYFPSVCALSALLDSLVDYPTDIGTDNHSFVAHYRLERSGKLAATRFGEITKEAEGALRGLRSPRRHAVILAGLTSFYLSAPSALLDSTRAVTESVIAQVGPIAGPVLAVMRLRRGRHSKSIAESERSEGAPLAGDEPAPGALSPQPYSMS